MEGIIVDVSQFNQRLPWTSDDVEYLKDVAEHHAGRLLRRQRWRPKSMYNGQEPPLWIGGRGSSP